MKAFGYTRETVTQIGAEKDKFPAFKSGDTIAVTRRIKEGDKERLQVFEGDVIKIHNRGVSSSFTVRKIGAHGVAVELIIPFNSPMNKSIELLKTNVVRRAKLYYVRDRLGKSARLKEKIMTQEQKEQQELAKAAAHDNEHTEK